MKKLISFLTNIQEQDIDNKSIKSIIIDLLTNGAGIVILFTSLTNFQISKDGVSIGSALLILGILIKIWKKELMKKKL